MMVVMYTLHKEGDLLLGPRNRRVYASFGPKRHAFEFAVDEGSGVYLMLAPTRPSSFSLTATPTYIGTSMSTFRRESSPIAW